VEEEAAEKTANPNYKPGSIIEFHNATTQEKEKGVICAWEGDHMIFMLVSSVEEESTKNSQWAPLEASTAILEMPVFTVFPVATTPASFPSNRLEVMSLAMRHGIRINTPIAVYYRLGDDIIPQLYKGKCVEFRNHVCYMTFIDGDSLLMPLPVSDDAGELIGGLETMMDGEEARKKTEQPGLSAAIVVGDGDSHLQ
jgi:hypothetical protein